MKKKVLYCVVGFLVCILMFFVLNNGLALSAGTKASQKPGGIPFKSLKKVAYKNFPKKIVEMLNREESVRDFEADRTMTLDEYIKTVGDDPTGYYVDLNSDSINEMIVILPGVETASIFIYKAGATSVASSFDPKTGKKKIIKVEVLQWKRIAESFGEIIRFGPSKTHGFLDIVGRVDNQDTGGYDPLTIVWNGIEYAQK